MKIGNFRSSRIRGRFRTEADVSWEDSARAGTTVFFEISGELAPRATVEPNAFVTAAVVPAIRHGERRIVVEGDICPALRDGIAGVEGVFRSWSLPARAPILLEPSDGFRAPRPADHPRSAVLLSGGVDSLFTLRRNRLLLPSGHPASFRDALRVRNLMFPVNSSPERRTHIETRSARSVGRVAAGADLAVTEIDTNVTTLHDDFELYARWSHGSVLAAVAASVAQAVTDVTISASHDVWTGLRRWGSHPLLDPLFGTAAVSIHHEGIAASRLQKAGTVARWPLGLESLYVCEAGPFPGEATNCGRCEKCLRTRVALLAGGGIAEPPTFPSGTVSPAEIDEIPGLPAFRRLGYYWEELSPATARFGRPDLAAAIDRLLRRARDTDRWVADRGWKGTLRRIDRRFLHGRLLRARRMMAPR